MYARVILALQIESSQVVQCDIVRNASLLPPACSKVD